MTDATDKADMKGVKAPHGIIAGLFQRTDSYGFVLILLATLIWGVGPLVADRRWASIPAVCVYGLAVVIAMHTSSIPRRHVNAVITVATGLTAIAIAAIITENSIARIASNLGFAVAMMVTGAVVIYRVMNHHAVTTRTISGAVSVYLLIAMAFAEVYAALEIWQPGSFSYHSGSMGQNTMQYFSLVTIATLGYGDIVPISNAARSFATLETITGQIFLVTIVARLVSMFGTSKELPDPRTHEADP